MLYVRYLFVVALAAVLLPMQLKAQTTAFFVDTSGSMEYGTDAEEALAPERRIDQVSRALVHSLLRWEGPDPLVYEWDRGARKLSEFNPLRLAGYFGSYPTPTRSDTWLGWSLETVKHDLFVKSCLHTVVITDLIPRIGQNQYETDHLFQLVLPQYVARGKFTVVVVETSFQKTVVRYFSQLLTDDDYSVLALKKNDPTALHEHLAAVRKQMPAHCSLIS